MKFICLFRHAGNRWIPDDEFCYPSKEAAIADLAEEYNPKSTRIVPYNPTGVAVICGG